MKYKCVEQTFYDRIYNPGDPYTTVKEEEILFKDNPCWELVKVEKKVSDK